MAYNGSGTFNRIYSWVTDKANTVAVTASRMDTEMDGFATGLSTALTKDGQTTATARIPFSLGVSAMAGATSGVSYAATNDANTGLYFPAADQWGLVAGGASTLNSTASLVTAAVPVSISATTTASNSTSGAFIVAGGVGIASDIFVGGTYNGKGAVPIGTAVSFSGTSAPSGWIFGYGQNISRTTYAAYFAVASTTYGSGDGSTTFGVPDYRGRVIAGKDDMGGSSANRLTAADDGLNGDNLGATGGGETQTLATTNLPAHGHTGTTDNGGVDHTHAYNDPLIGANGLAGGSAGNVKQTVTGGGGTTGGASAYLHTHTFTTGNTGSGTAFGIVQPSIIHNVIIYVGV